MKRLILIIVILILLFFPYFTRRYLDNLESDIQDVDLEETIITEDESFSLLEEKEADRNNYRYREDKYKEMIENFTNKKTEEKDKEESSEDDEIDPSLDSELIDSGKPALPSTGMGPIN